MPLVCILYLQFHNQTIARSHLTFSAASSLTQLSFLLMRYGSAQYIIIFLAAYYSPYFSMRKFFPQTGLSFLKKQQKLLAGTWQTFDL